MAAAMAIARLVLSFAPAGAVTWVVADWSLDYGFCKAASPLLRREMLEPIRAEAGDVVDIRYARDGGLSGHDVIMFEDEASWEACDESKALTLASKRDAGGGCANSSDFRCLRTTPGVEVAVPATGASLYLACSGMHCLGGVKLRVDVVDEREERSPSSRVVVPEWTDDFGFCSPLGGGYDSGVHRPHGLPSIVAYEGEDLVFKYSTHHNVWLAPDSGSYADCDFEAMVEVGSTADGGGCENDDSLGPYGTQDIRAKALLEPLDGYSGGLGAVYGAVEATCDDDGCDLTLVLPGLAWHTHGVVHVHEGTSCDAPGGHFWPTPAYDADPWGDGGDGLIGGAGTAAWSASNTAPHNAIQTVEAGGFTFDDVLGKAVVVHDHNGVQAACGVLAFERPSEPFAADDCLRNVDGFSYPLTLEDPMAVALRDHVGMWGFGAGTAGANHDFVHGGAADGAVVLHFVCQIHDHCANGQKVVVFVLPRPDEDEDVDGDKDDSEPFDDPTDTAIIVVLMIVVVGLLAVVGYLHHRRPLASEDQLELRTFKGGAVDEDAAGDQAMI